MWIELKGSCNIINLENLVFIVKSTEKVEGNLKYHLTFIPSMKLNPNFDNIFEEFDTFEERDERYENILDYIRFNNEVLSFESKIPV